MLICVFHFILEKHLEGKHKLEAINYDIRYLIQFLKSSFGKKAAE